MNSMGAKHRVQVHRKSTPLRKPRNSGGSPSGVSEPPILADQEDEEHERHGSCARGADWRGSCGRISTMEAPVVPRKLAVSVPKARIAVLVAGVPTRLPLTRMPPATTNSANSRRMKGI